MSTHPIGGCQYSVGLVCSDCLSNCWVHRMFSLQSGAPRLLALFLFCLLVQFQLLNFFFILKSAVGHPGTLRLPRKPWRSGRTDSHPTGDHFVTPFVLRLSKHERASSPVTATFWFILLPAFVSHGLSPHHDFVTACFLCSSSSPKFIMIWRLESHSKIISRL